MCSGLPYIVMGVDLSVYSFVGRGLMGNSSVKSGEIIDAIQICRITINSILKGYFAGVKIKNQLFVAFISKFRASFPLYIQLFQNALLKNAFVLGIIFF